jgi:hypothetical protein
MENAYLLNTEYNDIGELLWFAYLESYRDKFSRKDVAYSPVEYRDAFKAHCQIIEPEKVEDSTPTYIPYESRCTYFFSRALPTVDFAFYGWTVEDIASNYVPIQIEVIDLLRSKSQSKRLEPVVRTLWDIYREYSVENWDGYGAAPISELAIREAIRLLQELPSSFPSPAVVPEPNGEIALEWYKGKKSVFVVSFQGNKVISYAGLFGENEKTWGRESFKDSLPESVVRNIRRIFSEAE